MKRFFLILFFTLAFTISAFSQTNNTVDITDEVYTLLKNAEIRGLCDPLPNVKPYTEGFIVQTINTIID